MNKHDITLIAVIIIICLVTTFLIRLKQNSALIAKVYYNSEEVLKINLSEKGKNEYVVTGYNGLVKIEKEDNKIRVVEENSTYHLCSKQGYISKSYETIVCLPNKILIKIENNDGNLDAVIR